MQLQLAWKTTKTLKKWTIDFNSFFASTPQDILHNISEAMDGTNKIEGDWGDMYLAQRILLSAYWS